MYEFISMISDFWLDVISVFDQNPLQIGQYQVSFFAIVFAFLVVSFVVSLFWKGARA